MAIAGMDGEGRPGEAGLNRGKGRGRIITGGGDGVNGGRRAHRRGEANYQSRCRRSARVRLDGRNERVVRGFRFRRSGDVTWTGLVSWTMATVGRDADQ